MTVRLERDDATQTDFAMWRKRFPGRGMLALSKELGTDDPVLILVPAHNVGEREPPRHVYRIKF